MFGFRWLRRAFQYWQWGGEIYYLAQGMGGGMSFGFKRNSPHSIFTLTLHPLLWHLSTTYSTQVLPGLHTSCRYDYNAYSYESDLSLGVALHPLPITFNSSCFRFCVGVKKGLSLMYQHNLDPVAVKFGFVSNEKQTGMGIEFSYVAS
ncbi:Mitochondrial distribution and morphology protein 10 [Coelomomyces lativittatus]|nr:Mitochondrial distribution and morphology protein 10 [Coelomomyces lativittatus]